MSELTGRYNYERLGEKPFQKLCNALLAQAFPDVQCFPVGHRDGGRDAVLPKDGKQSVIFQVKWTSTPLKDPSTWLARTIREESDNIRRLASEGAAKYYLMTSVAGTAVPKSGTMDRLSTSLAQYSREFGIPMAVWWRSDVDARVDGAPDALKWVYSDMLAGNDLVRYFIEGANAAAYDHELRTLVMKVIATQWEEDARVKFKQAELASHDLADLFVDVEAVRTSQARATRGLRMPELEQKSLGGAATYLLSTSQPFTLVRGEPGQGKSTLGQYLCQVHRAAFLKKKETGLMGLPADASQRVPLRIDLRDYASWLDGNDPLEEHLDSRPTTWRRKASLEEFVAYFLRARSGGRNADVTTVNDITERLPVLVVFDGLDEVARAETRTLVVKHINEFSARLPRSHAAPRVIVTTRPNAAALSEPSTGTFETIALSHLKPELRTTYLRKWAAARSVTGRSRRELERVFHQRSAEPHITQLANNPMQLSILLYLLQKRGTSVPTGRTELYSSYMETFLDREAEKSPHVEEHRRDLDEVTAFLGWRLQSNAEQLGDDGRIALKELRRAILNYLFDADKNQDLVDALFTAVTDRVWALTSKLQGTFEFDVQPLREYFAARFLYEYAGAGQRDFDSCRVLRHLVRRPYWTNVARFYAGFARPNELGGLVDALEEEKDARQHPLQVLTAAWTLLADGVFRDRPHSQRRAAQLFLDDLSVRLLSTHFRYQHDLPALAADRGGREVARALLAAVDEAPASALAADRVLVASRLLAGTGEFETWWQCRLSASAGGPDELVWLTLGAAAQAGPYPTPSDVPQLLLTDVATAAAAVTAGLNPPPDSEPENMMVRAVLTGHGNDIEPTGTSYPADLLRVLAPQQLLQRASPQPDQQLFHRSGIHRNGNLSRTQQQAAWRRLIRRDPRLHDLQQALKAGRGEQRTNTLWANTAQMISKIFGPCWLAAQTAVIGAAVPVDLFVTGGTMAAGSQPLGLQADYGRLVQEVRRFRDDPVWWSEQYAQHTDDLSRATWALALVTVAHPDVVTELAGSLDDATSALPGRHVRALLTTASTLALHRSTARFLPSDVLYLAADMRAPAALLLAYHDPDFGLTSLKSLTTTQLAAMHPYSDAAWPAVGVLTHRVLQEPSAENLHSLRSHSAHAVIGPSSHDLQQLGAGAIPMLQQIIEEPAAYPRQWVWAAQEVMADPFAMGAGQLLPDPFLADVAAAEAWFATD
ncbi:MAG: hypothetical protein JWP44_4770 [Mucilaginibacter sp.]|nr:hypothetical protein [Mucilaginibacter sp.]